MPIQNLLYAVPACGALALLYAVFTTAWITKQDPGNVRMQGIAEQIFRGAMAFLAAEYKVLAIFVVVIAGLLILTADPASSSPLIGVSFVSGALCSALAGFFGMRVATRANVRTAAAARTGLSPALSVAFRGGAVMGMCVVGLGLVGFGSLFLFYLGHFDALAQVDGDALELTRVINLLAGFSMGASSIALFARVGGGIYTKAADVGADLVGKVEAGIPEDHFLNPATIADNVGDNVGDVAGMGADLFESYIGAIVGTMVLGAVAVSGKLEAAILPLLIAGAGIVVSILGTFFVRTKEGGNPQVALDTGSFGAAFVMLPISYLIIDYCVQSAAANGTPLILEQGAAPITTMALMWAIVAGLVAGVFIGLITGYYCSKGKRPVNSIVDQSKTGPATNIIAGIGVGFESTAIPIFLIAGAIWVANDFAGLYGVALAALGMLSTTGIQLAVDAYGPISDNAGGIAEMSGLPPEVRGRTDNLDAVGNTTAAIGKGFAIASAALAALSLFAAYRNVAFRPGEELMLTNPEVLIGLLVGGMLPFLFSAMAMKAVGSAAMDMITEVRRQFREIPVLRAALALVTKAEHEGRDLTPEEDRQVIEAGSKTEVERCVAISTQASIRRMVAPGMLALISPVVVGLWSRFALGGLLAGTLVSGVMLAIFMSNAGGAWDNAKKQVEDQKKDTSQEGNSGKGSDRHKAAVIGDTVGDPFKDTAGPSLNILIKLMTIVAVVIAPTLLKLASGT
ncbi:sodium-translocating pyrophosphatase [Nannocystis bainbridge]|uniref:Putative K(+)-stimulated pyrophosphate-energized sodium pump n=1 Tax=Nannocystis bainbridge TaxID=2995303 RepID=A0ABT5DYW5_9BACT|nr:sodium-translocating pyrophosphatase [Nannocystis bainbridge]MDC0718827.1 sodium-translocating pyrophosphatase [Nannocystis bainbridge]